jgi:nicotinamide-nucleotide amidase
LLGHKLTDVPGSSDYFLGGVTAYANEMKVRLADVPVNTLKKYGAVSAETASEMARGIREAAGSDIGLSTTGIAGPGGGSKAKPVGLVFIGISAPWEEKAERFLFTGERHAVKKKAAGAALDLLRLSLLKMEIKRT